MTYRNLVTCLIAAALVAGLSNQSYAVPTKMVHMDTPTCDTLSIPTNVHEIGDTAFFPGDEALFSTNLGQSTVVPCPGTDNPTLPEFLIDIRNLSGIEWHEVWYVADQDTNINNFDGEADDALFSPLNEAFRIDNDASDPNGIHHPLLFESMTPDGIWEINETWQFVLQDYFNSNGLPPESMTSIGVGSASIGAGGGAIASSGSIIAVTIPEPTSAALVLLGCLGVACTKRNRQFQNNLNSTRMANRPQERSIANPATLKKGN